MASLDNLQISEEKKKYITETLNPVLEEFVTECLKGLPSDPLQEMLAFAEKKGGGGGDDLVKENARLKAEMEQLKAKVEEAGVMVSNLAKQEDKEEEEEDDDDDDCDELPEDFRKPEGQMSGARASVSAEAYGSWNQKKAFTPPEHPKTPDQKARLKAVLGKSFLFSALDEKDMELVIMAMVEKVVEPKVRLINQGEDGDFLFVIEEGQLDCFIKQKEGDEKLVKTCEAGDAFGELALLYNCSRAASVESKSKSVLWQLDRETFNHIVKDAASKKREKYEAFLSKVPLLGSMDAYERSQVADGLQREVYDAGKQICVEDDPGDKFFILEEGEAFAEKKNVGKVMEYQAGDYFGELALLRNQPRAATVIAKTAVTVLALPRSSFKRLLGSLDDILQKNQTKYE